MVAAGHSSLWISWHQSSILRAACGALAGERVGEAASGQLPPGEWLFAGSDSQWKKRGHHHGIYAAGRVDDGHAQRLGGSGNPDVSDAAAKSFRGTIGRVAE